ncbi:MAG TPA: cytochrome c oxidase subunit 3 [Gemmatimonadaceae bacterium]|nr:cytochrome c oxidase subunit 3 [Gemmatimonadaceae bacterium]
MSHYTTTGLEHRKIGFWTFIGSECMLFGSLIATYLIYKGKSAVGPLPHEAWTDPATGEKFNAILNIPVTSFSAFLLLMSSVSMVLAYEAVKHRTDMNWRGRGTIWASSKLWLWVTIIFGTGFLICQSYEFTSFVHEGLTMKRNLFGSSFFTLTGFHGAHVTVGVLWLTSLLVMDYKRGLQPKDAATVDIAALYWHFVDIVWIAIFTLVYLIQ